MCVITIVISRSFLSITSLFYVSSNYRELFNCCLIYSSSTVILFEKNALPHPTSSSVRYLKANTRCELCYEYVELENRFK